MAVFRPFAPETTQGEQGLYGLVNRALAEMVTAGHGAATWPAMHGRVGLSFPELRPPSFRCTDITDTSLTFHYDSEREDLSDLVIGLIEGLGHLFELAVTIRPLALKAEGAHHDTFDVTYAAL